MQKVKFQERAESCFGEGNPHDYPFETAPQFLRQDIITTTVSECNLLVLAGRILAYMDSEIQIKMRNDSILSKK